MATPGQQFFDKHMQYIAIADGQIDEMVENDYHKRCLDYEPRKIS